MQDKIAQLIPLLREMRRAQRVAEWSYWDADKQQEARRLELLVDNLLAEWTDEPETQGGVAC